jgi:NodT family efflux transporter outer membrane factor (OMF) lipoprotein
MKIGQAAALAACLAGCAVGPDFATPEAPKTQGYSRQALPAQTVSAQVALGEAQHFDTGADVPGDWWALFHSPALSALVARALKNNPNLDAAQAALRQSQYLVRAQNGLFYPQVTASFAPSRNLTAVGAVSPASASGNPYYTLYTLQGMIQYTPDIFGLNRRTVESLQAQTDNLRFQLEATYLTLTSNVVVAAILEASLRGQIAATRETIEIEQKLLGILHKQFDLGQVAMADVVTQEAALAQAQSALPALEKALAQQRDLLAALTGELPADEPTETFSLDTFTLPRELPVSLPARLIEQRPDVRAAAENLHAASAQVGIAVANRLPNLTLSAFGGWQSNTIGSMFGPGTAFWTLAGEVAAPVFDGFTLFNKENAAREGLKQAAALYKAAVITAFQNVADTLKALVIDAQAVKVALSAQTAAAHSLQIARSQLELGQVAYLSLLNAEQTFQVAKLATVQAQAARLTDTAGLFQALGGGWWHRTDVVAEAQGH